MKYKYKLKEYVEQGYDFNKIFPEKVEEVSKLTGMLFGIDEIVDYLQKQTNDFRIENPVAKDLDSAIYNLILKYEQKKEVPEPEEEEIDKESEEWLASADSLLELLKEKDLYNPNEVEEWTLTLEALVEQLELKGVSDDKIKIFKDYLQQQ
jgi:hypothetical protein